jgi:hypothetical protein
MMKVYLDNCCFNRPFDDQSSLTVRLETEAILDVQGKIESGIISVGWSYILDLENNFNPFAERRAETLKWKERADSFVDESPELLEKMDELTSLGIKPLDALHIACAIMLKCDYFLTVDKGILRKANHVLQLAVVNPVNAVIQWEAEQ